MKGTTHLAAGVAVALLMADKGVAPAAAIIAGSVLPDIDSPKSLVGRHWPIIPKLLPHRTIQEFLPTTLLKLNGLPGILTLKCLWSLIRNINGMKNITHSFLFYAAAYLVTPHLALGILIHIFLDMLHPKGLKFFWPCGVSIRVPIISKYLPQDGVFDRFFGGGLYFCNVYLFVCLIMHQPAAELLMEAGAHIAAGLSFW